MPSRPAVRERFSFATLGEVQPLRRGRVTFSDGDTAPAKVVGVDAGTDLAVIKVEPTSYRALPKGKSKNLKVGEWVMAIGSPFGLTQSVTAGIVSATERSVAETTGMKINDYESFIQTDATINPGAPNDPILTGTTKVHSLTIAVGGVLDLAGNNLTINGGAFSNDGTVKLQGVESVSGLTQDVDSGTWTYTGRGTSTPLNIIHFTGGTDYFNLVINDTHATPTTFRPSAPDG